MTPEAYEQACAEHEWDVPERYNIAADVCDRHDPGKLAMVWERYDGKTREVDWCELQSLANRAAHLLASHGVEKGDRVAVVLLPTAETAAIFFGTWKLGLGNSSPKIVTESANVVRAAQEAARSAFGFAGQGMHLDAPGDRARLEKRRVSWCVGEVDRRDGGRFPALEEVDVGPVISAEIAWHGLVRQPASLWYYNIGHGRAEIADAVREQMATLEAYHTFQSYANPPALALAEKLAELSPIPDGRVFLTTGGGDAFDSFCPIGPCIVPSDEIPDPQQLDLMTTLDGEVVQRASTSQMIFSVRELVAFCSRYFTLEAGAPILTGTPWGCGEFRDPRRSLGEGDVVRVEIGEIGGLENRVSAPRESLA